MLEKKLPDEFKDKWRWRPGQMRKESGHANVNCGGKDLEETEGWVPVGGAHHGIMAHTWGNLTCQLS
jgi:hypothetical protein